LNFKGTEPIDKVREYLGMIKNQQDKHENTPVSKNKKKK
jgi:hypothetical protein